MVGLVAFGAGKVVPDCSGYQETVAERVIGDSHALVPLNESDPDAYFAYEVRHLEDGWTAEDVRFIWRMADGTLVEEELDASRVAFSVVDHYRHEAPRVEMVMRQYQTPSICDDEERSPQMLTRVCAAMVVIYVTQEQLLQVFPVEE
jgi:hypothetical protein